ncbi:MAG TPA: M14 family metallocarboxypeptidase [Actinomycetota bacterium]|nr:M14 family metallocarboxypeptidase [Actinomycetota bacterium]
MKRTLIGLAVAVALAASLSGAATAEQQAPPRTGFEKSEGAAWTTHGDELKFLAQVDALSERVSVSEIGKTAQKRPLQLVHLGYPRPRPVAVARREPTVLFVCTQHGNEPAGREACLMLLRDLAFTDDRELLKQLAGQTILFIPTVNPDGREANARGNSTGVDINRDHLNLETPEARAVASVVLEWEPDAVIDLHEYGPSIPVVYDDEVLYLWPRNLNTDQDVHDLAVVLAEEYIAADAEAAGYTADEYGQYEVADQNVYQSAGDADEGIARNAMGLRHSLGILVETRVDMDVRNGPGEVQSSAAVMLRRVDSHMAVSHAVLRFMRERGIEAMRVTAAAERRKILEGLKRSAPVYFGGADNQAPTEEQVQDPPPCGYLLTAQQVKDNAVTLALHGIRYAKRGGGLYITLGQAAEPLIPLLLDQRGTRHSVEGEPVMKC